MDLDPHIRMYASIGTCIPYKLSSRSQRIVTNRPINIKIAIGVSRVARISYIVVSSKRQRLELHDSSFLTAITFKLGHMIYNLLHYAAAASLPI